MLKGKATETMLVTANIVERVPGVNLDSLTIEPKVVPNAWHELGQDLARLHRGVEPGGPVDLLPGCGDDLADPRLVVEQRVEDGWVSPVEARWLLRWLDRLAPLATTPIPICLCHADVQMSNLLINPSSQDYLALIDWGCAHWVDPAFDFLGMPLQAVPLILEGYRDVASQKTGRALAGGGATEAMSIGGSSS